MQNQPLNLKERQALRAIEAMEAMADYLADAEDTRERTIRLRTERLAKEAADRAAPPPPVKKTIKPRKRVLAAAAQVDQAA